MQDVAYAFRELCRCVLVQWRDSRTRLNPDLTPRGHAPQSAFDYERCREVYGGVRGTLRTPFSTRQQERRLLQASGDPDVIGRLVLLLASWYFAWAPGGEYVSPVRTSLPFPFDEIPVHPG